MSASPRRIPASDDQLGVGHGLPDELVDRARSGDRDAVADVIAHIRPVVANYCRGRLRGLDRSDIAVDDIVQEVCMEVLAALPGYHARGRPLLAFVYGVASRKVSEAYSGRAPGRDGAVDGPERALRAEMIRLLGALPDKQREVLVMRVLGGFSIEETAEVVGSTPGAVRVTQHRALARLRSSAAQGGAAPLDVFELLAEHDVEPLRRSYLAYVESLAPALDLDAGFAHLEDRYAHRDFVAGIAGQLNLDAGLDALLRRAQTPDP
ncbi:RNA polymerase sigma factor (sigma-70 family) [Pseudonocardia kunmingensis]|uniref:RNA polymerase sigma factor (Sigma-70 family) n=1 Tax=Pseudonocardia kunmingensis TaxID=630975 RepID=A0A543DZL2_9PSEU|nr:RNA polymerase sigma factor (sigma-70 family) [Pseudonocardia kunmingensis]